MAADGRNFDTGKSYAICGANACNYDRIPNFPAGPRVQIELLPEGESQQRIRIYVDPDNKLPPAGFVSHPRVTSEASAITLTVEPI